MASRVKEIGTICRFCLCQERLMALSEAIGSAFAAEDVLYYTGIQISEKEELPYAICHVCCNVIRNSVRFRSTCLEKDVVFKTLLSVLNIDKSAPDSIERTAASTLWETAVESNTETITLDESDSDDSIPSLYGEAMQETLSGTAPSVASEKRLTSTAEKEAMDHTLTGGCEENEKSTSNEMMNQNDESGNLMPKDDSDSDGSLPSLYGESAVPPPKPKYPKDSREGKEQCHVCGSFHVYVKHHVQRVHEKKMRHACPYCPKRVNDGYQLNSHINTWHKKEIIFTCQHCGKGYINHSSYVYHLANSHGKNEWYECETCHKKWKSIDSYRKHKKSHSVTAIRCDICRKTYKNEASYEQHVLRYHPT